MNLYSIFKKYLLVLLVIIVFGIAGCGSTGDVVVSKQRPAPLHEKQLRSPGPHHMWVKGHWNKTGLDRWVWVPGHWVRR